MNTSYNLTSCCKSYFIFFKTKIFVIFNIYACYFLRADTQIFDSILHRELFQGFVGQKSII